MPLYGLRVDQFDEPSTLKLVCTPSATTVSLCLSQTGDSNEEARGRREQWEDAIYKAVREEEARVDARSMRIAFAPHFEHCGD